MTRCAVTFIPDTTAIEALVVMAHLRCWTEFHWQT